MNTSRLLETIETLLREDGNFHLQSRLSDVNNQLVNLASQPSQPQYQTGFATGLEQLRTAYRHMQDRFEPAQIKRFEELEAAPFFIDDIPGEITRKISENPATPAVVQQYVGQLLADRQHFLDTLNELRDRLARVGVTANRLEPGKAEIGFTIPRQLFDDNLDGLIGELREIRFIIRAFSEAVTGSIEPIVVRQISTTDPLFFFSMAAPTIIGIGEAVHWILDTWKKVEEIREVRERTRKLRIEGDKALLSMFDNSIKQTVDAAVEAKVKELVPSTGETDGRKKELETHLDHALHSLFARIERGMTIEIKFLPPPVRDGADPSEAEAVAKSFAQLAQLSPQLVFPPPAAEPILTLPRAQGTSST